MTRRIRTALATFVVGFLVEGGAEAYQLVSFGQAVWVGFYYVGLVTTGIGFYLMYRGRHEWTDAHKRSVRRGHRFLGAALGMFVGAIISIAILGEFLGTPGRGAPPPELVWVVGGLVALSLGNFFLSLVVLVERLVGPVGRALSWAGFAWSLGVSVFAGYLVGNGFLTLLRTFITDPVRLVVSFAPLAFALSPLVVAYLLFAAAYVEALRRLPAKTGGIDLGPTGHGGAREASGETVPAS